MARVLSISKLATTPRMDILLHTISPRRPQGWDSAFLVVAITAIMTGMIGAITKAGENIMMEHILFRPQAAEMCPRQQYSGLQ
jgi:hypothetical protein